MVPVILASRFLCEVIALIIFGLWGYLQWEMIGAIGVPLMLAVIWAMFGSPKAPYKLEGFFSVILELIVFLVASYFLYSMGHMYLALLYFIIAFGISILIRIMNINL